MKFFIINTIAILLLACNSATEDKQVVSSENIILTSLSGEVYFYGPELDTTTCKATGECDCCSGKILFINDSVFVEIDYCEGNTGYCKGHYYLNKGDVIMKIDSLHVNQEYNWEKETDTNKTAPDYFITKSKEDTYTHKISSLKCNNNIAFKDSEGYFYAPNEETDILEIIEALKTDDIWQKLEMKP
jgi:hypothetical protein